MDITTIHYGIVSRTIAGLAFGVSALTHLGILSGNVLAYSSAGFMQGQIWRPVTAFLLTSPQLGIILDPIFLLSYGSRLENGPFSASGDSGDFLFFLAFCATSIVVFNAALLGGALFCLPLMIALAYYSSQLEPNNPATYFFLTVKSRYIPFLMVIMICLMSGATAAVEASSGILAAHLYLFLKNILPGVGNGVEILRTPAFLRIQFSGGRPDGDGAQKVSTTSWSSRGAGQRLGT